MRARLAVVLLIAGCALPTMLDLDGRPIPHPARVGHGDRVWLVVDTASSRERVLVEVFVDTDELASRPELVLLGLGTGEVLGPLAIRAFEASCPPSQSRAGAGGRIAQGEFPPLVGPRGPQLCFRLLKAEFTLRSPLPESITVVVDDEHRRVAWERKKTVVVPAVVRR